MSCIQLAKNEKAFVFQVVRNISPCIDLFQEKRLKDHRFES
jgi:hypothetical protein